MGLAAQVIMAACADPPAAVAWGIPFEFRAP
jgi:hypothetical protein